MRKALIAVPSFAGIYPRPFQNFCQIVFAAGRYVPPAEWKFAFLAPERSALVAAMNELGRVVVAQNFDCLIVFDDDCFPPFDCVPRLLSHRDDGHVFVAGVGVMRGFPHTTTVGRWYAQGPTLAQNPDNPRDVSLAGHAWLDNIDDLPKLATVDFCGFPVAMIGREAFTSLAAPWFGTHGPDGGTVTHDIFFCRKLQGKGYPVLVDTTLKCGHLTDAPVITFENRSLARELSEAPV